MRLRSTHAYWASGTEPVGGSEVRSRNAINDYELASNCNLTRYYLILLPLMAIQFHVNQRRVPH